MYLSVYVSFFIVDRFWPVKTGCVWSTDNSVATGAHFAYFTGGKNSHTFPQQERSSWGIKAGEKHLFLVETFWRIADMLRFLVLTSLAALGKKMTLHTALQSHSLLISFLSHSLSCYLISQSLSLSSSRSLILSSVNTQEIQILCLTSTLSLLSFPVSVGGKQIILWNLWESM